MDATKAPDTMFVRLIEKHANSIYKMCCLYLKDASLAEDAMQDTFLKAFRNIKTFRGQNVQSDKAWLMRIAINTCKDYRRGSWFRHRATESVLNEQVYTMTSRDTSLAQEIMAMPRKEKEVVLLYYYQELKVEEIASILGIGKPTVYDRLRRARKILQNALGGRENYEF